MNQFRRSGARAAKRALNAAERLPFIQWLEDTARERYLAFQMKKVLIRGALVRPRKISIPTFEEKNKSVMLTYTLSNIAGHGSFLFLALSYLENDFLNLRLYAVSGITLAMVFQYYREKPLIIPLRWNALFMLINGAMIIALIKEANDANNLPEEQKTIYESVFRSRGMKLVDFSHLMMLAKRQELKKGDKLIQQGTPNLHVHLVESGRMGVTRDGKFIARLAKHKFVGEMSFLRWQGKVKVETKKSLAEAFRQTPKSTTSAQKYAGLPSNNKLDSLTLSLEAAASASHEIGLGIPIPRTIHNHTPHGKTLHFSAAAKKLHTHRATKASSSESPSKDASNAQTGSGSTSESGSGLGPELGLREGRHVSDIGDDHLTFKKADDTAMDARDASKGIPVTSAANGQGITATTTSAATSTPTAATTATATMTRANAVTIIDTSSGGESKENDLSKISPTSPVAAPTSSFTAKNAEEAVAEEEVTLYDDYDEEYDEQEDEEDVSEGAAQSNSMGTNSLSSAASTSGRYNATDAPSSQDVVLSYGEIASADVVCLEDSVVYTWTFKDLNDIIALEPAIGMVFESCISADLNDKIGQIKQSIEPEPLQLYMQLMIGATLDGHVEDKKKKSLDALKRELHISDKEHLLVLRELGWTLEDFEAGFKGGAKAHHISEYKGMLKRELSRGSVSNRAKDTLREYRQRHKITAEKHIDCLYAVGWTLDEYEIGQRKVKSIVTEEDALRAVSDSTLALDASSSSSVVVSSGMEGERRGTTAAEAIGHIIHLIESEIKEETGGRDVVFSPKKKESRR